MRFFLDFFFFSSRVPRLLVKLIGILLLLFIATSIFLWFDFFFLIVFAIRNALGAKKSDGKFFRKLRYTLQRYWARSTLWWMGVNIHFLDETSKSEINHQDKKNQKVAQILLSNHLSYLDIIVLLRFYPASFIAKRELKHWLVIGWLMQNINRSIFIDRQRKSDVLRVSSLLKEHLLLGERVIIFPESKINNGERVGELKSTILEPIVNFKKEKDATFSHVEVAVISYGSLDKHFSAKRSIIWHEDHFLMHFLKLLMIKKIEVRVVWFRQSFPDGDRKLLKELLQQNMQKHYEKIRNG